MSLRDEITTILNNEGAASEGGWHSWRCFDKGRYPEPCHCTEVVAEMVVNAALDAAREAVLALHPRCTQPCEMCAEWDDALAAIDALSANADKHPDVHVRRHLAVSQESAYQSEES